MNLKGQRWRFDLGNNRLFVDNAYCALWGQERVVLNGEVVAHTGGWLRVRTEFSLAWLAPAGEDMLEGRLFLSSPGIDSVECFVAIGNHEIDATDRFIGRWTGRKWSWPEENVWMPPNLSI
jgi:hypothetical protein